MSFAHDLVKKLAERREPDGWAMADHGAEGGIEVRIVYLLGEEEKALLHIIDEGGKEGV